MTDGSHTRLLIADDHPLFRGAMREAVGGLLPKVEIAEAGTFDEIPELLDRGASSISFCSISPCRACADFPA